jgi:hypothetical protein
MMLSERALTMKVQFFRYITDILFLIASRARKGKRVETDILIVYPVYATTRNCLGSMTRKLSVTALRNLRHRLGTSWRRKPSVASAESL